MKIWCPACQAMVDPSWEDSEWSDYVRYAICPECNETLERHCAFRDEPVEDDGEPSGDAAGYK